MTQYAKVQNNSVVWGPSDLPQAYTFADGSTTGNFNLMDPAVIKAEGFIPVVTNLPSYDPSYQVATALDPVITSDSVTYNWTVADKDLNAMKLDKKNQVNNIMQSVIYSSVITLNGNNFTMSDKTMSLVATLNAAGVGGMVQDDAGDFQTLSASDMSKLYTAGMTRFSQVQQEAAKAASDIAGLTTAQAVAQYNISIS